MEKKIYYEFSDGCDMCKIVMDLQTCMDIIESDEFDEEKEYTIKPVLMTKEEYQNLPEACI